MNKIFMREVEAIKRSLLALAAEIEKRMGAVFAAIAQNDIPTLARIIETDREIDLREIEIEEECLKVLALHQPVARDLRFVVVVMKINNDLERIADILANIADRGCRLAKYPETDLMDLIRQMGALATEMLRESLECMLSLDVLKAVEIIKRDDELDALNLQVVDAVIPRAEQTTENAGALFLVHGMARDIERIGDHATNIAEDVAYLVDGLIIRHGNNNYVTGGAHAKAANPGR
ncbi:MAG: phosphate signaling complex protein PhoU [Kiritimatiellia bacterium]|jgi:phosphate transport system protein